MGCKVIYPVIGYYNYQGYRVMQGDRILHSAGNHPRDSQQSAGSEESLPLRTIRHYCYRTCAEIAAELQAPFGGVERMESD